MKLSSIINGLNLRTNFSTNDSDSLVLKRKNSKINEAIEIHAVETKKKKKKTKIIEVILGPNSRALIDQVVIEEEDINNVQIRSQTEQSENISKFIQFF